jgi:hypothetical protein
LVLAAHAGPVATAQDARNQQEPAGCPIVHRQFEWTAGELQYLFRMETRFGAEEEGPEPDSDSRLGEEVHETHPSKGWILALDSGADASTRRLSRYDGFLLVGVGVPPSPQRNAGPDGFDKTKRPRTLQKSRMRSPAHTTRQTP